tara:strand:- start:991 stop:1800 length:810 start_codon:yes stop_codon:yes gene_type:complete
MNFGHVGYIPAYIRHHPDLNAVTKLVYAEITANIEMQGYCKKKNSFFAKVLGSSASTISACITKLRRFNLIKVVIENEEDTNKFINRYIMLTLPEISVGVNNDVPTPYTEISVGGDDIEGNVMPHSKVEGAEISDTLLHSNNNIQYIYSTKKGQVVINKVINEKQLNYLKNIVNNFYTIQSTNFAEIVKRDWHKDSNLTSGSINVLFDLITLDKWDDSKVRDVINWIVKDSFWASKCYSLRVLRDKAPNGQSKFTNMYASYIDKMKGRG